MYRHIAFCLYLALTVDRSSEDIDNAPDHAVADGHLDPLAVGPDTKSALCAFGCLQRDAANRSGGYMRRNLHMKITVLGGNERIYFRLFSFGKSYIDYRSAYTDYCSKDSVLHINLRL